MKKILSVVALCGILATAPALVGGNGSGFTAQAQVNVTVKGQVLDENGEPAPFVGVVVKDTTIGTTSDVDGNFSLTVPSDATVQFISLGYDLVEVNVAGRTDLGIIRLTPETTVLDQIVVIGYGSQRKVDLTGSVTIVDADEMKKTSNSNISTMLEGKVAGVQITTDGQPGADPSVRIRGLGSFNSTAPLYVIDGVPMGTSIRDFSPNDIETIQVLKDASAAAIYGSRAANGVVIITTKGGKKNQPLKVDYRGYVGIDQIRKGVYDVMDAAQYGDYIRMAYANSGLDVPAGYDPSSSLYLDPSLAENNTDWFKEMFKTGIRQNHNVNLSGGGENNTFNIGLDYFSQKGTMVGAGPNYDRFTARVNNTMDTKFVKFRTGIVYSHSKQDNMALSNANEYVQGLYGGQYPVMQSALIMPPTYRAYDESTWVLDDKLAMASEYSYDSFGFGTYYQDVHGDLRLANPLLYNTLLTRNTLVDRIVATGTATVDLLGLVGVESQTQKLSYNMNLSYSRTYCKDFTFVPSFIASNFNYLSKDNERLTQGYRSMTDALVENYITYDGKFGKSHLNVVAGQTFEREDYHTLTGTGISMPEPYFMQVGNGLTRDAYSYESEHVLASYIGRVNYDYDGRYLLQATVRRDGSSRLSAEDRWEWFPSVSAGWRIDKEPFFAVDPTLVSLLKMRVSYGVLGNENIGEYQYMPTMSRNNFTYSFGGNKVNGSAMVDFVNSKIRWEKKKTFDIGVDYAMFGGALELTADYYDSRSEDLLYGVSVPAEAGVRNETVTMNAATMKNTGLEFSASYHNYQNPLKFDVSGNFTLPKNTVMSLGASNEPYSASYTRTEVGYEVGRFYGYVYEGIFQTQSEIDGHAVQGTGAQPGDVAYKDIAGAFDDNGNPIPDGQITDADQTYIGSGMSKFQFGLSFHLEYKGFDLSVATFGATGYKVLDHVDMALRSSYGALNKSTDLLNAWTPSNPSTTVPRVAFTTGNSITNDMFSSRYLQNGAYWKISTVELGYNFDDKLFGGYLSGVRVYVSGQNLATISAYRGYNIDFAGGTFTPGYNYCSFPTPMTLMFGVNLSF